MRMPSCMSSTRLPPMPRIRKFWKPARKGLLPTVTPGSLRVRSRTSCMFSRSMSSVVMTETVAGTSSSGRRVRVAAVVTASSWVGTGCAVVDGAGVAGGGEAAGGGAGGVCADSGTAIVPPSAVLASKRSGRDRIFIASRPQGKGRLAGSGSWLDRLAGQFDREGMASRGCALFGEDQLVRSGDSQAVRIGAVPDDQFAPAAHQRDAIDDRRGEVGRLSPGFVRPGRTRWLTHRLFDPLISQLRLTLNCIKSVGVSRRINFR